MVAVTDRLKQINNLVIYENYGEYIVKNPMNYVVYRCNSESDAISYCFNCIEKPIWYREKSNDYGRGFYCVT